MTGTGTLDIVFSLLTLTVLEIILGIDNLVFISILSHRLPLEKQKIARRGGLAAALVTRLLLLGIAFLLTELTKPLFTIANFAISARDLFFILGGIFLFVKSVREIHHEYETVAQKYPRKIYSSVFLVMMQIALLDVIFSLDSILTAVGLAQHFWVMATAISIAIVIMFFSVEILNRFIQEHPSVKMLGLSFLLLIGTMLVADGIHFHIPRGYIYFAVCFSLLVEFFNITLAKKKSTHSKRN